jgi:hypothetical protein
MKHPLLNMLITGAVCVAGTTTLMTTANAEVAASKPASAAKITKAEVNAAQQGWCDALVAIGKTHQDGGDAKALATKVLTEAYDYDKGSVFFKPTLAYGATTFRPSKEGALSYFVGGDPNFSEDKGFALKPWVKARYDNLGDGDDGIQIHDDIAITMGNVWVTAADGAEVMVDKTFVFKKGDDGKLRLIVHKSSLPYSPDKK